MRIPRVRRQTEESHTNGVSKCQPLEDKCAETHLLARELGRRKVDREGQRCTHNQTSENNGQTQLTELGWRKRRPAEKKKRGSECIAKRQDGQKLTIAELKRQS